MISRILVANRAEIALRVIRTARDMGIESVAVYSDSDRDAQFVTQADQAYALGGESYAETYMNIPALLDIALPISGFRTVEHRVESTRYMPDADGLSAANVVMDWSAVIGAPVVGGVATRWPSKTVGVHMGALKSTEPTQMATPLPMECRFLNSWSLLTKSVHQGACPEVRI